MEEQVQTQIQPNSEANTEQIKQIKTIKPRARNAKKRPDDRRSITAVENLKKAHAARAKKKEEKEKAKLNQVETPVDSGETMELENIESESESDSEPEIVIRSSKYKKSVKKPVKEAAKMDHPTKSKIEELILQNTVQKLFEKNQKKERYAKFEKLLQKAVEDIELIKSSKSKKNLNKNDKVYALLE